MKIYISGYYGQNNLGDDYIFYSILDQLGNLKESVNLNVEIGSNIFASKVYESLAKNYENITLKYTLIGNLLGKLNKVCSLIQTDYWIIGGGYFSGRRRVSAEAS